MNESKFAMGLKLISALGYPGLFLGLFVEFLGIAFPGEIVLAFTGFLVWNGHLKLFPALFSAVSGALSGTIIAYYLGRRFGRPFLEKFGRYLFIRKKTITRAERWFTQHAYLVLLLGRFIPGIRPLSAYTAGISQMKFGVFLPLSLSGTTIWCFTFIMLGNKLGQNWGQAVKILKQYDLFLIFIFTAVIITYFIFGFSKRSIKG